MGRYYLDSCIWRDYIEDRSDNLRPLGEWAFMLIKRIIAEEGLIVFSDLVEEELLKAYTEDEIKGLLGIVPSNLMVYVKTPPEITKNAADISKTMNVPKNDVAHALLARGNGAILVSRDKHFYELQSLVLVKKPEELI